MGVGTHLYGSRDRHPDGSYIATEWAIAIFLPLWPLRSFRVRRGETKAFASFAYLGASTPYQTVRVPLHKRQVASTYLLGWGCPVVGILLLSRFLVLWVLLVLGVLILVGVFFIRTLLGK